MSDDYLLIPTCGTAVITTATAVSCFMIAEPKRHDDEKEYYTEAKNTMFTESASDADNMECLATCSCSSGTFLLTAICVYLFLAIITNLIACYKFVVAWNLISEASRMDRNTSLWKQSRQRTLKEILHSFVNVDTMNQHTTCPICLNDFFEDELVTACDDGCGTWFHEDCLFDWLEHSDSCPCCRNDMLAPKTKSWMADLSAFLGYPYSR